MSKKIEYYYQALEPGDLTVVGLTPDLWVVGTICKVQRKYPYYITRVRVSLSGWTGELETVLVPGPIGSCQSVSREELIKSPEEILEEIKPGIFGSLTAARDALLPYRKS